MSITSIGAYEAKTHLARLIDQVERGDSVTITKHGRPVARLVPVSSRSRAPEDVIAAMRQARAGIRRGADSVRDMMIEGRR
jgi:prevent-host-death family protein